MTPLGQTVHILVGAYGMFWFRDEVDWAPGRGRTWDLLGRRGTRRSTLQVADFKRARGVYVLFDDYGAHYVGLARGNAGIGGRLRDHTKDEHRASWSRFCWFAFDAVSEETDAIGVHRLMKRNRPVPMEQDHAIGEIEALLITIMNTRNVNRMRFQSASQWEQVSWWEREETLAKLSG